MAFPALAFSGCIQATFLCISTCDHSRSMMLERRRPVASANTTTGRNCSGMHFNRVVASSLVSHLTRLLTGFLTLITGALRNHFHSSAAIFISPRMKDRCWLRVAADTGFGSYSGTGLPRLSAAFFFNSHRCRCFLLGILATAAIILSSVIDERFFPEKY